MQPKHISEKELAARWSISCRTLQRWRLEGRGLPYYKIGKVIRYPLKTIEYYEKQGIRTPDLNDRWGTIWQN